MFYLDFYLSNLNVSKLKIIFSATAAPKNKYGPFAKLLLNSKCPLFFTIKKCLIVCGWRRRFQALGFNAVGVTERLFCRGSCLEGFWTRHVGPSGRLPRDMCVCTRGKKKLDQLGLNIFESIKVLCARGKYNKLRFGCFKGKLSPARIIINNWKLLGMYGNVQI